MMGIVADKARQNSIIDRPFATKRSLSSRDSFAITPSDTTVFTKYLNEIIVGGAGTVIVEKWDRTQITYTAVAGQTIRTKARRVLAASTATGLVGNL